MTVTADRLLRALWKDDKLLLEALSLLSIERIALPWRRTQVAGVGLVYERRSIFGTLVADSRPPSPLTDNLPSYRIHAKALGDAKMNKGIGTSIDDVLAKADWVLGKRGWLVVNLPHLGPWESMSTGGWGRKNSLGEVVAWVKPQEEPRQYKTFVILDEEEAAFEGTLEKAMAIVDRNLEHLGFSLG